MTENPTVKQLHGIAARLAKDPDAQKELMQEMFVHLVRIQAAEPGHALSWYLESCEFHGRNYLEPDCNLDLPKRGTHGIRADKFPAAAMGTTAMACMVPSPGQIEIQGELITNDILNLIFPHLSYKQHRVLFLLMKGFGVRQAARELGITHPAVIKHRNKIARIARQLLQESEGIGVAIAVQHSANETGNGNGNGEAHNAQVT